jgi:hypothetical protein
MPPMKTAPRPGPNGAVFRSRGGHRLLRYRHSPATRASMRHLGREAQPHFLILVIFVCVLISVLSDTDRLLICLSRGSDVKVTTNSFHV